jgi:hypothetical protein
VVNRLDGQTTYPLFDFQGGLSKVYCSTVNDVVTCGMRHIYIVHLSSVDHRSIQRSQMVARRASLFFGAVR